MNTLFETKSQSIEESTAFLQRLLNAKAKDYAISFGIFKGKRGGETKNTLLTLTDKQGRSHTFAEPAQSLGEMIKKVNEYLQKI